MYEWGCCFDYRTEVAPGQNCFKPVKPIDTGMAAGLAVGIFCIVLAIIGLGYLYMTRFGNPLSSAVPASLSNPLNSS